MSAATTSPPLLVIGNLDCEARWHGAALPRRVLERISAAATLLRYLFDEPIELWTPAPVDPARLRELPGAPPLRLRSSATPPPAARAGWGAFRELATPLLDHPLDRRLDPRGIAIPAALATARAVNDRRFASALAARANLAPPGAATITSLEELRRHLAAGGADASPTAQWICKAPLSAAGRDRALGQGPIIEGELERALARLLARFAALTFEPWLERTCDLGVCAVVRADAASPVVQRPPHTLLTTPRGGFCGIAQTPPPLTAAQRALLTATVEAAGRALRDAGYLGPFNVDAFLHRDRGGAVHLRPLCEINARLSFGWIAAALAERHGHAELGFSPLAELPAGATVLVAPDAADPIAAWAR